MSCLSGTRGKSTCLALQVMVTHCCNRMGGKKTHTKKLSFLLQNTECHFWNSQSFLVKHCQFYLKGTITCFAFVHLRVLYLRLFQSIEKEWSWSSIHRAVYPLVMVCLCKMMAVKLMVMRFKYPLHDSSWTAKFNFRHWKEPELLAIKLSALCSVLIQIAFLFYET